MKPQLLMCPPNYFGVNYTINPWMQGQAGRVDAGRARRQWDNFFYSLERAAGVELMTPSPDLPDLVFTANAGLLLGENFILSRFRHPERRPEEPLYRNWFKARMGNVIEMPEGVAFEGAGDALLQPGRPRLWAGYGFRTDRAAHAILKKYFAGEVVSLRLVDPRFYHLDTCFCPLQNGQILYYPDALDAASRRRVESRVPAEDRIEAGLEDALLFACNAVLAGRALFLNHASPGLQERLCAAGYTPVIRPVTEFLKAGGANKCLTIAVNPECPREG